MLAGRTLHARSDPDHRQLRQQCRVQNRQAPCQKMTTHPIFPRAHSSSPVMCSSCKLTWPPHLLWQSMLRFDTRWAAQCSVGVEQCTTHKHIQVPLPQCQADQLTKSDPVAVQVIKVALSITHFKHTVACMQHEANQFAGRIAAHH